MAAGAGGETFYSDGDRGGFAIGWHGWVRLGRFGCPGRELERIGGERGTMSSYCKPFPSIGSIRSIRTWEGRSIPVDGLGIQVLCPFSDAIGVQFSSTGDMLKGHFDTALLGACMLTRFGLK